MRTAIQALLLAAYRLVRRSGVLDTRLGQRGFFAAYDFYKSALEATEAAALHQWVRPGSWVVDVGANVGFFTRRFAAWVGDEGKVLAIEPETRNLGELRRAVAKAGVASRIEIYEGVAADRPGTLRLATNPDHPGDHRLAADGIEVVATTLDNEFSKRGWPPVSLIKIDVQGAESLVLEGARELVERYAPTLYIEVDPAALMQQGRSVDELLDRIRGWDYSTYLIETSGGIRKIGSAEIFRQLAADGSYLDLLCVKAPKEFVAE